MRLVIRLFALLAFVLAMLAPAGGAAAEPAETTRVDQFTFTFNACNGEFVLVEGTYHIVTKQKKDGFVNHVTFHGQGTGNQGNEYVVNLNNKNSSKNATFRIDERLRVISKGSAPNAVGTFHFDSSSGQGPSFEVDCRG